MCGTTRSNKYTIGHVPNLIHFFHSEHFGISTQQTTELHIIKAGTIVEKRDETSTTEAGADEITEMKESFMIYKPNHIILFFGEKMYC